MDNWVSPDGFDKSYFWKSRHENLTGMGSRQNERRGESQGFERTFSGSTNEKEGGKAEKQQKGIMEVLFAWVYMLMEVI